MRLVFATHNTHKLLEVQKMIPDNIELMSLSDVDMVDEIPETADTLQGNAILKAKFLNNKLGYNCFADDTGLEVEILSGAPGVYSARYAGPAKNDAANMDKLLQALQNKPNRKARFVTVICMVINQEMFLFEGELRGKIIEEKLGSNGFGYDPIFMPDGFDITLAQMDIETKNRISHRGKAFRKMAEFLKDNSSNF